MADLSITSGSVTVPSGTSLQNGTAGETITAGQTIYLKSTDGLLYKAKNDSTTHAAAVGVALNGASANQPLDYVGSLPVGAPVSATITLTVGGSSVTKGSWYAVSSTYGGICPVGDLTTGNVVTFIGYGASTSTIVLDIIATGLTL